MIILDTNVVSAFMRRNEEPAVIRWLDKQTLTSLYITTVTVHELRFGVESLKDGRRRAQLDSEVEAMLALLADRVLPLDMVAARSSGRIQGERKRIGRPVDLSDCLIAGIAISHKARVATRNTRHFSDLPVEVIDPWTARL
jgi:predicted nucleic acid-binding protein